MMKKQRTEEEEDRISQLPQPLLHHILCYLSQREAIQTCVLSKSWRHLGPTRPKIEFREKLFRGKNKKEKLLSVLDTTLQRYHDQKLSIEYFGLETSQVDSLLQKWVPLVFRHLARLHLELVDISDETFQKIMSCCPSIEDVRLNCCEGLKTINLTDKLKYFGLEKNDIYEEDEESCDIKMDDVQTIEKIRIMWGCPFWFQQHCHKNFMHLKVLCLGQMRLSAESFGTFSRNFPCLQDLTLDCCYGFEEMKLSSCSIERLTLSSMRESLEKVTIHAPNILYFHYGSYFIPSSFSFTTASGRNWWKSDLWLGDECIKDSSSFFKLNQVLRALSQSQITLDLSFCGFSDFDFEDTYKKGGFVSIERVAVEHLVLKGVDYHKNLRSSISFLLTLLFRVCRPRNIEPRGICAIEGEENKVELAWLLCKFLQQKRKVRDYSFPQGFNMELCDDDECLFRLKWRELS